MQIATWNINSLKVRLSYVLEFLVLKNIDILCLQELKITNKIFPMDIFYQAGYQSFFVCQKTYNGVAILVRRGLHVDKINIVRNLPNFNDVQQRMIAITIENSIRIISVYVPNGQALGTEKFLYKLNWLNALIVWLKNELTNYPYLALVGDFNIAPEDIDVYNPNMLFGCHIISYKERNAFQAIIKLGMKDIFRMFNKENNQFTWWDYRKFKLNKNAGLRIDHILFSNLLAKACISSTIEKVFRYQKRPSDHVPVIAQLRLPL